MIYRKRQTVYFSESKQDIIFARTLIKRTMKNLTENLSQLFVDFTNDATLQVEKGNKTAGTRARKTSLAIEKALKEFRKMSIEHSKK